MAIAILHESAFDEDHLSEVAPQSIQKDRRSEVRLSADDASWLRGARLKYGPEVRVVDISAGGILIESESAPLEPRTNVVFELSGPTGALLVPARVLRSHVVANGAGARHQTACEFKRPLSIETLAAATVARAEAPAPSPAPRPSWQRVVARFRDGRLVRGYTNDFHPSKPHLHLTPEDKSGKTSFVALSELKAVFFVREFAGDPSRVESTEFPESHHGRKVEVTFKDGEVLIGTTLAYRADGSGFFVHPADPDSNNMRVFVSPGATRHVRLL